MGSLLLLLLLVLVLCCCAWLVESGTGKTPRRQGPRLTKFIRISGSSVLISFNSKWLPKKPSGFYCRSSLQDSQITPSRHHILRVLWPDSTSVRRTCSPT